MASSKYWKSHKTFNDIAVTQHPNPRRHETPSPASSQHQPFNLMVQELLRQFEQLHIVEKVSLSDDRIKDIRVKIEKAMPRLNERANSSYATPSERTHRHYAEALLKRFPDVDLEKLRKMHLSKEDSSVVSKTTTTNVAISDRLPGVAPAVSTISQRNPYNTNKIPPLHSHMHTSLPPPQPQHHQPTIPPHSFAAVSNSSPVYRPSPSQNASPPHSSSSSSVAPSASMPIPPLSVPMEPVAHRDFPAPPQPHPAPTSPSVTPSHKALLVAVKELVDKSSHIFGNNVRVENSDSHWYDAPAAMSSEELNTLGRGGGAVAMSYVTGAEGVSQQLGGGAFGMFAHSGMPHGGMPHGV